MDRLFYFEERVIVAILHIDYDCIKLHLMQSCFISLFNSFIFIKNIKKLIYKTYNMFIKM